LVLAPLTLVVVILLAASLGLTDWSTEGRSDAASPVIVVDEDGHCRYLSPSCSELLTLFTVWTPDDTSVTTTSDLDLHLTSLDDGSVPAEAVLLLPSPPPRSA